MTPTERELTAATKAQRARTRALVLARADATRRLATLDEQLP